MKEKIYVHYGHEKFEPEKLLNRKRDPFLQKYKPTGLWGSPVDSEWGWIDWCKSEGFRPERLKTSFKFKIDPSARILEVRNPDDVRSYIIAEEHRFPDDTIFYDYSLDTSQIEKEYDGMEVYMNDNYNELHNTPIFYVWDVDSLVVWNPDMVIPQ